MNSLLCIAIYILEREHFPPQFTIDTSIDKQETMISFLPVTLTINGEKFSRCLEYDSHNVTKFKMDLRKLTWEMVEFLDEEGEARRPLIDILRNHLLRINTFWHEQIFLPVSNMISLPEHVTCYCFKGHCAYDLFHTSHYVKDGSKVKVDIFACPPSISMNVANQSERDLEKLRDYYISVVRKARLHLCCQCVPLSKELISILKTMISEIEMVLEELAEEVVHVKSAVLV